MDIAALCLALNLFFEARDQSPDGMAMVAEVTMNRVASDRYPDTVCGVVWQPKQFSWTHDGKSDKPDTSTYHDEQAWTLSQAIAAAVLAGERPLGTEATHYHAASVTPFWADKLTLLGKVDDHLFYN